MKVDSSIKSLLQGVSQQPPRDRLPGQCTDQLNMSSDPVTGLTRRPPTDLVGDTGTLANTIGWYDFETKDGIRYLAKFKTTGVSVVDMNGVSKTVNIDADALTYLAGSERIAVTVLENQMTIVNTSKIVQMLSTTATYANQGSGVTHRAIIQVLGGQYGRTYSINLDGVQIAAYGTVDGHDATMAPAIKSSFIAEVLAWLLTHTNSDPWPALFPNDPSVQHFTTGAMVDPTKWVVTRYEDMLLIDRKDTTTPFKMTVGDDQGNVNFKVMSDQAPDISDLPRYAPYNYVVRIAQETDPEEDLWLKFVMEDTTFTTVGGGFGKAGYWIETVAPDIKYKLDPATMPIVMDYDVVTEVFHVRRGDWKDRQVGTLITNPDPSFVGNTINDVTSFQNRLVFLSGSYVIMSRTNRHDDFWIGSASAIVDSDPIDISSTAVEASLMMSAIPHNRDLVIFSKSGQFIVFGRTALTPANATLVLTTSFEAELAAKPVASGRNIFFATNFGRFTGMREFYTEGGTDINDTRPITQHVKEFITGKVRRLASSSNYDLLAVQTQTQKKTLYTYQFIWSDNEKVQSSWSRWEFGHDVEYVFFEQATIYLVVSYGDNTYLWRMSLDVVDAPAADFPLFLDNQFDVLGVNTQFILPYADLSTENLIAVQGAGCPNPGMRVPIKSVELIGADWVATLKYDMLGGDIVVGSPFRSQYIPTMPFFKDQDGVVVSTASLIVKQFIISISQTGNINAYTRSRYGQGATVTFEGRIVGDINNVVGNVALSDDKFIVPFREDTRRAEIVIYTEDYLPMTMLDIEWVGQYSKSGKRISSGGTK